MMVPIFCVPKFGASLPLIPLKKGDRYDHTARGSTVS